MDGSRKGLFSRLKGMDRREKAEYVAEYYWAHFLALFLVLGLAALVCYHLTFGKNQVSLSLIIVNERAELERDARVRDALARALSLPEKEVRVDSAYQVSCPGHPREGAMESDYEKFFFGWSMGELDWVVMPGSLWAYVQSLGGEAGEVLLLSETSFFSYFEQDPEDPLLLVAPSTGRGTGPFPLEAA